jgi:hypothetical protein
MSRRDATPQQQQESWPSAIAAVVFGLLLFVIIAAGMVATTP